MIKTTSTYAFFYTEWPSNFCKTKFVWEQFNEKHEFFCTEQAFMWAKAKHFGDFRSAQKILNEKEDPTVCKMYGREVLYYEDAEWEKVRYNYMLLPNLERFRQDKVLQAKLLEPKFEGLTFVEASPWDKIWGVGMKQDDPLIVDPKNWKGRNLLGQVITECRATIKNELN